MTASLSPEIYTQLLQPYIVCLSSWSVICLLLIPVLELSSLDVELVLLLISRI